MHLLCYKVVVTGDNSNNKRLGKGLLSTTILTTLILQHLYHCNNIELTTKTHTYKAYIKFGKSASPAKSTTTNTHKNSTSYVQ